MTRGNHYKLIFSSGSVQQGETQIAELSTSLLKFHKNAPVSTTMLRGITVEEIPPNLFFLDSDSHVSLGKVLTNSNAILEPTTSEDVESSIVSLKQEEATWSQTLLDLIRKDTFETGYSTESERFFRKIMVRHPERAKQWVNKLFLAHFHDVGIVVGLLSIIAHMKYKAIQPQGPTMAVAGLSHKDPEVREVSIRCFENWSDATSLNILRNLQCSEQWLQDYLVEVIEELEEVCSQNAVIS